MGLAGDELLGMFDGGVVGTAGELDGGDVVRDDELDTIDEDKDGAEGAGDEEGLGGIEGVEEGVKDNEGIEEGERDEECPVGVEAGVDGVIETGVGGGVEEGGGLLKEDVSDPTDENDRIVEEDGEVEAPPPPREKGLPNRGM